MQTKEMGKPLSESKDEVDGNTELILGQLENAAEMLGVELLDDLTYRKLELHHEPFGVVKSTPSLRQQF